MNQTRDIEQFGNAHGAGGRVLETARGLCQGFYGRVGRADRADESAETANGQGAAADEISAERQDQECAASGDEFDERRLAGKQNARLDLCVAGPGAAPFKDVTSRGAAENDCTTGSAESRSSASDIQRVTAKRAR